MRIADLSTGAGKLSSSMRELRIAWDQARLGWNDSTSQAFEENYLQPLVPLVKTALDATSELAEVLARAERECDT
jgi:hypothetical protein